MLYKIYALGVAGHGGDVLHHQLGCFGLARSRLTPDIEVTTGHLKMREGDEGREQDARNDDTLVHLLGFDAAVGGLGEGVHVRGLLVLVAAPVRVQAFVGEEGIDPSEGIGRDQHRTDVGLLRDRRKAGIESLWLATRNGMKEIMEEKRSVEARTDIFVLHSHL